MSARCPCHRIALTCLLIASLAGCGPRLDSKDPKVRLAAVEKLTDEAMLAKVALEDESWDVRRTSIEKLTDQALLAKVAVEATDWTVRKIAITKLTDQGFRWGNRS